MYGYIQICKPELKFREFDSYRTYYCGLCHSLHEKFGSIGQFLLSYDITFLTLLLDSLYEPKEICTSKRCIAHPIKKQLYIQSEVTEYAADMSLLLSAYKFEDDWYDDNSYFKKIIYKLISKKNNKLKEIYIKKVSIIEKELKKLHELEKNNSSDPMLPAICFGNILSEILAFREDVWEEKLRIIGFHLGCYIYILDAFDDLPKDKKKNSYNPFLSKDVNDAKFIDETEELLRIIIAPAAEAFEYLPVIKNVEILRNILYAGIWTSFKKRKSEYLNNNINEKDEKQQGGNI